MSAPDKLKKEINDACKDLKRALGQRREPDSLRLIYVVWNSYGWPHPLTTNILWLCTLKFSVPCHSWDDHTILVSLIAKNHSPLLGKWSSLTVALARVKGRGFSPHSGTHLQTSYDREAEQIIEFLIGLSVLMRFKFYPTVDHATAIPFAQTFHRTFFSAHALTQHAMFKRKGNWQYGGR